MLSPSPPGPPPLSSRFRGSLALPSTLSRALPYAGLLCPLSRRLSQGPVRALPIACSRHRRPPHLVLRGARGAHGAERGGPGPPHASSGPGPPECRSRQHAWSRWRRRRSQSRGNRTAAGAQRGQREPARATGRHHSVPSGSTAIRTPGSTPSPLRVPCSGTFRSKFRVLRLDDPDSGIS